MFYYSKKSNSKIIHNGICFHLSDCDISDIGRFETLKEAYENGYRLCKDCSPLYKAYKSEEEKLYEYCQSNALTSYISDRFVKVISPYSSWKIVVSDSGNRLCLYHKNECRRCGDEQSEIKWYHYQKKYADTILKFLKYITDHDYYRMKNPVYTSHTKPKAPPLKGTRRYRNEEKRNERIRRKQEIYRVLSIIENLSPAAV